MGKDLNALVVDDEENARLFMTKLLEELLCFAEIRTAKSATDAMKELEFFDADIIFLDIQMPGKDGFSFINELPPMKVKPRIVFVTAFDQYALKAIKNQAFDYILKPVNRKELKECVQKYLDSDRSSAKDVVEKFSRIKINTRSGTIFVNPSSILYCQADGNYTMICTGEKQYLCSINLGKIKDMLPLNGFIRIGRSLIINMEYISILDRKEGSVTLVRDNESVKVKIPKHHLKDLDKI
ncbi:MAG TPA: LytTR family DNA-binding domain-containing protein [Bacteroidales bacterium]|nr:LytTR family DNA-binding domain-containing protein [Bacteroidales bacterium]